ncbi:hydroxyisourate hydrolase [Cordyceps militaris CM01]|uniref:Hydroxyisourate hydrolase n=1 Tax=Cordyceps militaris (strain CM01) TaxID=983644 RepID=G3JNP7_CORMM|nr:hydroxyisourate hydrolase [Cordyceps militaris CM01]EGX89887.1 hydroxyisourate hydrolase [Cordyceps militaris CM01]
MATEKDLITCHVLDTTAGRPAGGISVRLQGPETRGQTNSAAHSYTAVTDADGRAYFGEGKTFFPEAVVVFRVEAGQHYHVPLLLSPFTFTTYRGS